MQKMSSFEFQAKLNDQIVNTLRVLNIAFIMGVVFFAGVIIFIWSSVQNSGILNTSGMSLSPIINAVVFIVCLLLSSRIPVKMLESVSSEITGELSFEKAIEKIRTSMIMRIALLECPAIFGLVITLLSIYNGSLEINKLYVLNMIPAAVMVAVLIVIMPSRERIVSWYEMIK